MWTHICVTVWNHKATIIWHTITWPKWAKICRFSNAFFSAIKDFHWDSNFKCVPDHSTDKSALVPGIARRRTGDQPLTAYSDVPVLWRIYTSLDIDEFQGSCMAMWQCFHYAWWRHQMESFSASMDICAENSPVTGEFPAQRPVTRSFDVFFYLRLNKRLSKQSWGWWFDTPSHPLWRHCNGLCT